MEVLICLLLAEFRHECYNAERGSRFTFIPTVASTSFYVLLVGFPVKV
jgi:hypothetical protein